MLNFEYYAVYAVVVEVVVERARALGKSSSCSVADSSVRTPALKWRRTVNRTQDAPAPLTAGSAPGLSACYVWQYRNSLCLIELVLSQSLEKKHSFEALLSHSSRKYRVMRANCCWSAAEDLERKQFVHRT